MNINDIKIQQRKLMSDIVLNCNNTEEAKYKINTSWLNQTIVEWVDTNEISPYYLFLFNKLVDLGLIDIGDSKMMDIISSCKFINDIKSIRENLKNTRFGYYL